MKKGFLKLTFVLAFLIMVLPIKVNALTFKVEKSADRVIYIPQVDDMFASITAVVPMQLLAYHASNIRGLDVDKPRNLAKSVTVE